MRWFQGNAFLTGWRVAAWLRSLMQWRICVFRAMISEEDGFPKLGRSARALGVRTEPTIQSQADIPVDDAGFVKPRTGGLSLAIGSPKNLPPHRRPRQFGGIGQDPVFMLTKPFWAAICIRVDKPEEHHASMEPIVRCRVEDFEGELAATRMYWRRVK